MSVTTIDPTTLPGRPCSLASALQLVGDRWCLLIIREVMFGNHQFKQIADNTGAPTDRLSARLKDLVAAGVLDHRRGPAASRKGYYFTEAGAELSVVTQALTQWGDKWVVTEPPLTREHHGHQMLMRAVCATCGEAVASDEVQREMTVPGWSIAGKTGDPS
jgi:DNA-binding HxlR family transcriptional regulator